MAAEQAARTGWAKIIGDWPGEGPVVSVSILAEAVAAVRAVGGRLAVHVQRPESAVAAVTAGVDSIEHGMGVDPGLLDQMARRGIALTPTLRVITSSLESQRTLPYEARRQPYLDAAAAHPGLVAAAVEAGVTVLAGTDSHPHGRIIDEIRAMVGAGVPTVDALGAASWRARTFLGFGGLTDGSPADAVVYDEDPRRDLGQIDSPRAVVLRGRVRHRR